MPVKLRKALLLITLFTDASWCPKHKVGAYAAWMKVDGRTERAAGPLRGTIASSGQAEIAAMINGFWLIGKLLKPRRGTVVIAQTDCEEVRRVLDPQRPLPPKDKRLALRLRGLEVIVGLGLAVDLRHVEGHKGTKTKRNAVNTWCDAAAREAMGEARAALLAAAALPRVKSPAPQPIAAPASPPDGRPPRKGRGRGRRGRRQRGAPNTA